MGVAGSELVIPLQFASLGVQRDGGTGEQVIALADIPVHVRTRISYAPIKKIEIWIITAGQPGGPAASFPAVSLPGVVPKLAGTGNRVESPEPLSGGGIIRIQETANAELSSGNADNHFIANRQGSRSNGVPLHGVGYLCLPKHTPGPRIQRNHSRIQGAEEEAVAQQRNPAIE